MALKLSGRTDFRSCGPVPDLRVFQARVREKTAGNGLFHDLGGDQVAYAPPVHVRESVLGALAEGRTGYTEAIGTPAIRNAVAEFYQQEYGLDVTGAQVAVTTGGSGALVLALLSFFSPGQRVGVAVPGPVEYRRTLQALGLVAVDIRTDAASGYRITTAALDALAEPIDGLVVINPSNPAGGVLDAAGLAEISAWCAQNGVRLLGDETGHGLTYDDAAPLESVLAHNKDAVIIGSFSHRFAMPGWRMGWLVVPEDNTRTIECLAQSLTVSPPTLPQFAGIEALQHRAELDEEIAALGRNRDLAAVRLTRAGFTVEGGAEAGLYVWLRLPEGAQDSIEFCTALLEEAGIYLRPGVEFDAEEGARYVRLSIGASEDDFAAAIEKLVGWMEG